MTAGVPAGLTLRSVEVFATVIRRGTTVAAAEALGISQSAVSLTLAELEARLGFSLFLREKGRLRPNEAAYALLPEVEPLFALMGAIETRAADIRDGAVGRLRIMSTPPLGHSIVPVALRQFLARRPKVRVQYEVGRLERVAAAVAEGRAEIGLALGLEDQRGPPVAVRILRRDRMVALLPENHPLAERESIGPADMDAHDHVGLEGNSPLGQALRAAFDGAGVPYAPRVEVRYCHTAAVLANAGVGIAVVDRYTSMFLTGLTLRQVAFEPDISISACQLTGSSRPASRLAEDFAASVMAAL